MHCNSTNVKFIIGTKEIATKPTPDKQKVDFLVQKTRNITHNKKSATVRNFSEGVHLWEKKIITVIILIIK